MSKLTKAKLKKDLKRVALKAQKYVDALMKSLKEIEFLEKELSKL